MGYLDLLNRDSVVRSKSLCSEAVYVMIEELGLHSKGLATHELIPGLKANGVIKAPRWGLGVLAGKISFPDDIDSPFENEIEEMFGSKA